MIEKAKANDNYPFGLWKVDKTEALAKKIDFFRHALNEDDRQALLAVLGSLFLSTGNVVQEFENILASYVESRYALGTMSCTHALDLAFAYFGVGSGDEVITTPLSFVATTNVIERAGARPVFVDVEPETGNINADLIERAITDKTKMILPVHLYGQMCDMHAISAIAKKNNLVLVEDAAHCIEGKRNSVRVGALSDAACFSFYATKNITCGEGGALITNNEKMYEWGFMYRQHGMTRNAAQRYAKKYEHYDVPFVGAKCAMNNMQGALLINQLKRIDLLWQRRYQLVDRYNKQLANVSTIGHPNVHQGVHHAHHVYTIWLDPTKRDECLTTFSDHGIGVAVHYMPIHLLRYYREKYGYKKGDFPNAERIGWSTLSLPLYPSLTEEEQDYVIKVLHNCFR